MKRGTTTSIYQYERHGRLVQVAGINSYRDLQGFVIRSGETGYRDYTGYAATTDDVVAIGDILRPGILDRLRARNVL